MWVRNGRSGYDPFRSVRFLFAVAKLIRLFMMSDVLDFFALGITTANLNFVLMNKNSSPWIEIDYDLDSIVDGELQINGAQIGIGDFVI